ncbi:MAG: hypothetical protein LBT09_00120 [Planctomycetaceae bacterium]|nr:hypothetical protein [Planctomycetaceae bacterium]
MIGFIFYWRSCRSNLAPTGATARQTNHPPTQTLPRASKSAVTECLQIITIATATKPLVRHYGKLIS